MKRILVAGLSAIAVAAAVSAAAFAPVAFAGSPQAASQRLHRPARFRSIAHLKRWTPPARPAAMWRVPVHGGAEPTSSSAPAPACRASHLATAFWTSYPAMSTVISGFNVTNTGLRACSLPRSPAGISVATATGAVASAVRVAGPTGRPQDTDFAAFGSKSAAVTSPAVLRGPSAGLTLRPGGTATVLLYTLVANGEDTARCLRVPARGSLRIGLIGTASLNVTVPAAVSPGPSAFSSCGVVTVSAFLTWTKAKAVVGVPVPESTATGAISLLPNVRALYAAAP
jgi:hypothetical protein